MECKYGCGKKIKVVDFQPRPDKRTNRETSKDLNLGSFKLYYEIDADGDRGDLHMCPEFKKILDSEVDHVDCTTSSCYVKTGRLMRPKSLDEMLLIFHKEMEKIRSDKTQPEFTPETMDNVLKMMKEAYAKKFGEEHT